MLVHCNDFLVTKLNIGFLRFPYSISGKETQSVPCITIATFFPNKLLKRAGKNDQYPPKEIKIVSTFLILITKKITCLIKLNGSKVLRSQF